MSIEKSSDYVRIVQEEGGHHIKAWRKHFGLSVHHLSERVSKLKDRKSISASMISQLEQGKAGYTQKTLETLAEAMGLEPWQLLAGGPVDSSDVWRVALNHCNSRSIWDDLDETDKEVCAVQISNLCEAVVGAVLKSAPVVLRKDLSTSRKAEPVSN